MEMKNTRQGGAGIWPAWRMWLWAVCEVFVLYALLRAVRLGPASNAVLCLAVGVGIAAPYVLERLGWRMSGMVYVFVLFYLLATLAGRIFSLYYLTAHWDKLLHLCGGVAFALVGGYLPVLLNRKYRADRPLRILTAVMFSISVAALWEFFEFGSDHWFGTDMQRDTVVNAIRSYDLGDVSGEIGSIDPVESVTVNGRPLEGYLDIGLIDTMGDMMIETVGAAIYAVLFALDKGRHPSLTRMARRGSDPGSAAGDREE